MQVELRTESAEDTRDVGEAVAPLLRPKDAVVLTGELGAGKTTFVQGVARGLGVQDPVVSPTFTLVREYRGRLDVAHVDVFRLVRIQDVIDLGLEELGEGQDVLLVEWGDVVEALLPPDRLRVELTTEDAPDHAEAGEGRVEETRRIVVSAVGTNWAERWQQMSGALASWAVG